MTFSEYVNQLRLTHARQLLADQDSKLTIAAIALDSGFNSTETFYRSFREKYGLTPNAFRRIAKNSASS
jgi:AraC-like DNA-binding protein